MKKILVIGCPGSGKSTFSRALHTVTAIPLIHLDQLFWNADKTTVPKRLFLERMQQTLEKDTWILDGNYMSTMEERLQACDTVMFLDYATEVCLDGVKARKGTARSDLPWVELEDDAGFLEFIRTFRNETRPQILELLKRYTENETYIFSDRAEADAFLASLRSTFGKE